MKNFSNVKNNFRVVLASSLELAKTVVADATVEAEYGAETVQGARFTLAHHGVNSHNPAPCNWREDVTLNGGTILVSHIDLDTLGGVFKIMGVQPEHPTFWEAAEYIDTHGRHHLQFLSEEDRDLLNAYYAFLESNATPAPRTPFGAPAEIHDVLNIVEENWNFLNALLTGENDKLIEAGRKYANELQEKQDALVTYENNNLRVFVTEDSSVNVNAAYYSAALNTVTKALIIYRKQFGAFTLAFEDNGKNHNATSIMKEVFGELAGGHAGIAGSGRGIVYEGEFGETKLKELVEKVQSLYN